MEPINHMQLPDLNSHFDAQEPGFWHTYKRQRCFLRRTHKEINEEFNRIKTNSLESKGIQFIRARPIPLCSVHKVQGQTKFHSKPIWIPHQHLG